jgi:hypothetical protein
MAVKKAEGGKLSNKSIYVPAKGERILCGVGGGECRTEIRNRQKGCTHCKTGEKDKKTQDKTETTILNVAPLRKLCSSYFLTKEENISRPEAFSLERLKEKY